MDYHLNTYDIATRVNIIIVGCGGTGGFVAESVCRLLTGRDNSITLVDHDRVEPHNLLRQHFYREDIGQFKSKVLADRLARSYGRIIGYSTHPLSENTHMDNLGIPNHESQLIIGCVDNAKARKAMDYHLEGNQRRWLIDAGNGTNWGQILIGNSRARELTENDVESMFRDNICLRAPGPALQRPDILTTVLETPTDIDCAQAMDLTDQDPTINGMMAALVTQVTRRMLAGTCPFMGLYLDLELGQVTPSYVTPDAIRKIVERIPQEPTHGPQNFYDEEDYDEKHRGEYPDNEEDDE